MRVLPLLAALLPALPLAAQELLFNHPAGLDPKDPTRVEVKALFDMPAPGGYLPVRVTVVNQRKNDASLRFTTTSNFGFGDDDSQVESEFRLESKAGTTTTRDLLVPLTTAATGSHYGTNSRVDLRMSGTFGNSAGSLSSEFAENAPAILMSEGLFTPNASALDSHLNSHALGSSRMGGSARFAAKFTPIEMPEDWRAYCGYDAMLLTDDDWGKLGSGARTAILQWIRLGGRLVVYRLNSATSLATLDIEPDGNGEGNYGFGTVALDSLAPTMALDPASTIDPFYQARAPASLNKSINDHFSVGWELYDAFHEGTFSYALFVFVLIAFGILVGPVNLFVFAKSGMRHKLFITTPIISLGASALLIVLILVKDGVGGNGQRVALVEIRPDSGENNAYLLQEQISRTGVLLGGSFRLDEAAAITPVPIEDSAWSRLSPGDGGGGLRYGMNFEDGKLEVSGDWFQSRSEQAQLVRAVVPTRGRIELRSQGGAPVLFSTFEFPLETLHYRDASGGHWIARDLKPGSSATCTPLTEADFLAAIDEQAAPLTHRHAGFFRTAAQRSDHWFATSAEGLAVETFDSIRWRDDRTLLTGPVQR